MLLPSSSCFLPHWRVTLACWPSLWMSQTQSRTYLSSASRSHSSSPRRAVRLPKMKHLDLCFSRMAREHWVHSWRARCSSVIPDSSCCWRSRLKHRDGCDSAALSWSCRDWWGACRLCWSFAPCYWRTPYCPAPNRSAPHCSDLSKCSVMTPLSTASSFCRRKSSNAQLVGPQWPSSQVVTGQGTCKGLTHALILH